MRVAFVHDWLVVSGGAEKVTREILRIYDADVYALVDLLNDQDRSFILHGKHARTTFVQHLPFARRLFRYYLPLFPMAIERLDLSGYDLIISASYAVAKGVRVRAGQFHVSYIHTPMRYAWFREKEYLHDHGLRSGPRAWIVRAVLKRLRAWDLRTAARVDHFIANGRNVAERVRQIYGRDADILVPPVDTDLFTIGNGPRTYYISASRMVPYKRVDRIMEAFRSMPERQLLVTGDGPERHRLQSKAPGNVRFLGHVDQSRFVELLQGARALITAADEDLGLTPLEAQACGTPTIALRKGGYLETVKEGVNGIFFDTDDPFDIAQAVVRFEGSRSIGTPQELRAGMMPYNSDRFRARFAALVESSMNEHAHPTGPTH